MDLELARSRLLVLGGFREQALKNVTANGFVKQTRIDGCVRGHKVRPEVQVIPDVPEAEKPHHHGNGHTAGTEDRQSPRNGQLHEPRPPPWNRPKWLRITSRHISAIEQDVVLILFHGRPVPTHGVGGTSPAIDGQSDSETLVRENVVRGST